MVGKWFSGNIHVALLLKLLLMLALLFLSRIIFYLFNLNYYTGIPFMELCRIFIAGLRFDLSALAIINAPFIVMMVAPFRFRYNRLYQGIANFYFYFINIIALMANFVDTIYFRFTLKRLTFDIFRYLGVGGDFDKLVPQFLRDFWYIAVVWCLFVAALIYFGSKIGVSSGSTKSKGFDFRFYGINTLAAVAILGASVVAIRGGLQLRPIGLVTAGQYVSAKNIPLLLNTPFSIARTTNNESLETKKWFRNEAELSAIYTPVHPGVSSGRKNQNVMIIIMESFSREHIGILNHELDNGRYQGFTPFLDSLIGQSVYFDAFANGKTSIQGIPAVLSGVPSLMNESLIQSNYATDKFSSIASLLKPFGYTTAFFHGGTNGTMGFDSYSKLVGFDHYYGRNEFHNEKEYDGKWGIRDEAFLQYTAAVLDTLKKPFVAAFFSLSSHHPYYVPGTHVNVLRKGKLPIQQSIMYADLSLKKFFHTIRTMPWYGNTLFVITADHTSEGYYPYYTTDVGQYAIPIIFFKPGSGQKSMERGVAQQTDIMPTLLNYLGYPDSYVAFGSDLMDPASERFSIKFNSGVYGFIKDGWYMEFDGAKTTSLFNLEKDPMQRENLAGRNIPAQAKLELFVKAYVQQYNNRLIENRMTIEK